MKTLQKTIWINYLIIGISTMFISSCDSGHTIEYNLKTDFIYKNLTSENIEIILLNEQGADFNHYTIKPNEETKIIISGDGPKTGINKPFSMNSSTNIATKVILKFLVTNKCLTFLEGEGILDVKSYDNFSESMYKKSNNTLIYNIDSGELDLATTCL
jgi:hypothetical protein